MKIVILFLIFNFTHYLYAADDDNSVIEGEERFNVSGAIVSWKYEESGEVYSPISFETALDYRAFSPLEVSVRLGLGFGDAESDDSASSRAVNLDLYKLVYLKPYVSWDKARLYALLGYADYDISSSPSVESSGVSYGAGADYNLFDVAKVFFELRHLPDSGNYDLSSISMGFSFPY